MLNIKKIIIESFITEIKTTYHEIYGSLGAEDLNVLEWISRLTLENIANCDALYHNMEHTIMVALVGQEILKGKHISEGGVKPTDWINFMTALLCHDIGYVRGICHKDDLEKNLFATGIGDEMIELPAGATDAGLMPYHVDRGQLFIQERFGFKPFRWIDADLVCSYVEMTRFPIPEGEKYEDTEGYRGLTRAADLIGQLGDPEYLRKIPNLFYEFEENGLNEGIGYHDPGDMRHAYATFFWNTVSPYIKKGVSYLKITQEGKQWISNLHSHVFVVEHKKNAI
ncbi:MAG: metal-dependent phosphohydrolase [Methylococcaceae bacterium]|nr:metal-dependent phosphohydrolase [Methylococcaceae bacterium]